MRIDKVDVVAAFAVDASAPLKLGVALTKVAEANQATVVPLAVPASAAAHIPRFMVGIQQNILQVALDRIQLSINPPDHIRNSPAEVFSYVQEEVARLFVSLLNEPWMKNPWAGVILSIVFPIEGSTAFDSAGLAASAITKLEWPTDGLKSFQLHIGREIDGFFKGLTISGYELRSANLELKPGQSVLKIKTEDTNLDESGIRVQIDVNNRPFFERPRNSEGTKQVIEQAQIALETLVKDLNLEGVVK